MSDGDFQGWAMCGPIEDQTPTGASADEAKAIVIAVVRQSFIADGVGPRCWCKWCMGSRDDAAKLLEPDAHYPTCLWLRAYKWLRRTYEANRLVEEGTP